MFLHQCDCGCWSAINSRRKTVGCLLGVMPGSVRGLSLTQLRDRIHREYKELPTPTVLPPRSSVCTGVTTGRALPAGDGDVEPCGVALAGKAFGGSTSLHAVVNPTWQLLLPAGPVAAGSASDAEVACAHCGMADLHGADA